MSPELYGSFAENDLHVKDMLYFLLNKVMQTYRMPYP